MLTPPPSASSSDGFSAGNYNVFRRPNHHQRSHQRQNNQQQSSAQNVTTPSSSSDFVIDFMKKQIDLLNQQLNQKDIQIGNLQNSMLKLQDENAILFKASHLQHQPQHQQQQIDRRPYQRQQRGFAQTPLYLNDGNYVSGSENDYARKETGQSSQKLLSRRTLKQQSNAERRGSGRFEAPAQTPPDLSFSSDGSIVPGSMKETNAQTYRKYSNDFYDCVENQRQNEQQQIDRRHPPAKQQQRNVGRRGRFEAPAQIQPDLSFSSNGSNISGSDNSYFGKEKDFKKLPSRRPSQQQQQQNQFDADRRVTSFKPPVQTPPDLSYSSDGSYTSAAGIPYKNGSQSRGAQLSNSTIEELGNIPNVFQQQQQPPPPFQSSSSLNKNNNNQLTAKNADSSSSTSTAAEPSLSYQRSYSVSTAKSPSDVSAASAAGSERDVDLPYNSTTLLKRDHLIRSPSEVFELRGYPSFVDEPPSPAWTKPIGSAGTRFENFWLEFLKVFLFFSLGDARFENQNQETATKNVSTKKQQQQQFASTIKQSPAPKSDISIRSLHLGPTKSKNNSEYAFGK